MITVQPRYFSRYSDWKAEKLAFDSVQGQENYIFCLASRVALEPSQHLVQWFLRALDQEVNRPGRESDTSLPCTAEVKNA
jgi:hypothetical protein